MIDDLRHFRAPFSLWRWLRENETTILRPFGIIGIACVLGAILYGCASPMTTQEHEELHCAGYAHQTPRKDDVAIAYEWRKVRAESVKPWLYVRVEDVDTTCRLLGADAAGTLRKIGGCAMWQPTSCIIILPQDAK